MAKRLIKLENGIHRINGVNFSHVGRGKWSFIGKTKQGISFEKIEVVHGRENAEKVAIQIGAGLKRTAKGAYTIDGLSRAAIEKVIAPSAKRYEGIEFSQAFPLNPKH